MKTVLINSLEQLYDLLLNNEDTIYKDGRLAIIKDYLDAAYTGCACQRKKNEDMAFEMLKTLSKEVNYNIVYELKGINNIDKIIFQFDGLSFEL